MSSCGRASAVMSSMKERKRTAVACVIRDADPRTVKSVERSYWMRPRELQALQRQDREISSSGLPIQRYTCDRRLHKGDVQIYHFILPAPRFRRAKLIGYVSTISYNTRTKTGMNRIQSAATSQSLCPLLPPGSRSPLFLFLCLQSIHNQGNLKKVHSLDETKEITM